MKTVKTLQELVIKTEKDLARYKFVLDKFPDAKTFNTSYNDLIYGFKSKSVNNSYTAYEFNSSWDTVYIIPHCELEFDNNGNNEIIKVYSSPTKMKLAYIERDYSNLKNGQGPKQTIKFSKFKFTFKKYGIADNCIKDCHIQILEFIKKYPNAKLDEKNLDPKIKKLLLFT